MDQDHLSIQRVHKGVCEYYSVQATSYFWHDTVRNCLWALQDRFERKYGQSWELKS